MDDYLAFRHQLKDAIRAKLRKETGGGNTHKSSCRDVHNDNYGCFFGPSEVVVAESVVQETKVRLQRPDSALRKLLYVRSKKDGDRPVQKKSKASLVKEARDYSFLWSDDQISTPAKKDNAREETSKKNGSKDQAKDSKKCSKTLGKKEMVRVSGMRSRTLRKKEMIRDNSGMGSRTPMLSERKHAKPSMKVKEAAAQKPRTLLKPSEKSKEVMTRVSAKTCVLSEEKQAKPSGDVMKFSEKTGRKPQTVLWSTGKQSQQKINQCAVAERGRGIKRRHKDNEEMNAISMMIRRMFRYDPTRFVGDDRDDKNMEATFADIQKEESRSAKIAKKEDDKELMKIEQEKKRNKAMKI